MRARLAHQGFDGQVVQHVALVIDQTVLAVGGEGIEGHIGDDAEVRKLLLDRAHRRLRNAVGIPGLARVQRLFLLGRDRKQGDRGNLEPHQGSRTRASSSSTDSRSIPGMDATGWRSPRPSTTKIG